MPIEEGKAAPAFTLADQDGKSVKLSDFKGKSVVLYFYPADDTPGCTKESCAFRDDYSKLKKAGAVVLGVSPNDEASHQKFIKKYSLPFPLLVDSDHAVAEKYGAWGEKVMYGKKIVGAIRTTVIVGSDGKVAKIFPRVKVDGHVDKVLAVLKEI